MGRLVWWTGHTQVNGYVRYLLPTLYFGKKHRQIFFSATNIYKHKKIAWCSFFSQFFFFSFILSSWETHLSSLSLVCVLSSFPLPFFPLSFFLYFFSFVCVLYIFFSFSFFPFLVFSYFLYFLSSVFYLSSFFIFLPFFYLETLTVIKA